MGEASVLMRTVPTILLFFGTLYFCTSFTSAAPFQSTLRLPRDRGCYYLMKHYSNGERIETNEPCLNCTCVNSMLMCYLRICPFTKPAGPECVIRRDEGECCPTVWCPGDAIPTTETPTTQEPLGCFAGGEAYVDGAQLPRNPDNPCEVCYCIRNSTACVMQECELKVEGCTPVYREPSCCPSRYNCSRYVATTLPPGPTVMPSGCLVNNHLYADGERVVSENPCNHCYCMRDTVACAVEKCHAPGDGCIPQTVPEGQCCPDRYDCQGMEVAATDITTDEPHTTTPSIGSSGGELTDRIDTADTETPQLFSVSPDAETTTSSIFAETEETRISTPSQKNATEDSAIVSESETPVQTTETSEETSTLTTPLEEVQTQRITTLSPSDDDKTETFFSPITESAPIDFSSLSSLSPDSQITSTLTPVEKETESIDLLSTVEKFQPTDLPRTTVSEEKEGLVSTDVKETTTALHDLSSKETEQQPITTSSAPTITSTPTPEQFETSTLGEEKTKLIAEVEGRDKITQMVTEPSEKPEHPDVSTTTTTFVESSTAVKLHLTSDEVTKPTVISAQETESEHTTVISESTTIKFDTKPTQATTLEEVTAETAGPTAGTTTARPILPGSIPGEGNCHYATGTYQNGDPVIPVHPCEKDCVCNNSVVACDLISCEQVFEDSTNCRMVTKPDECCPSYECDPTIDEGLPPALNQTKEQEIPDEIIPSTTTLSETELTERSTTGKPLETSPTVESVKSTFTEETTESTTGRKQDSVSPIIKDETTEESTVVQTEESTEPFIDEKGTDTHITETDKELTKTPEETTKDIITETTSETPSDKTSPEVSLQTTSSPTQKTTGTALVTEHTTEFQTKGERFETSTEVTAHTTRIVVDSTEKKEEKLDTTTLRIEEGVKQEYTTQTESKVTTTAHTQPPIEVTTTKESITASAESVSGTEYSAHPESTETLELIGDTKPAVQITDHTTTSEIPTTKVESSSLETTTKIAEGITEKFAVTSQEDLVQSHSTVESASISEEETEPPRQETTVSSRVITSEPEVTTVSEDTGTTILTTKALERSTLPPDDVQTTKATFSTGKTEETTEILLTSSTSKPSDDTTLKPLEVVTTLAPSQEDDIVHRTSSVETTSEVTDYETRKATPTTEKQEEITESLQEKTSLAAEIFQPSQTTLTTRITSEPPSETETGIEEETKPPTEEKITTKSLLDVTESTPVRTESEGIEVTQTSVKIEPTEPEVSSTQSSETYKETSLATESSISPILGEQTTGAKEETKVSTMPTKLESQETISTVSLDEGAERTSTPEVVSVSDKTTMESVAEFGKTTVTTSQKDQTVSISDITYTSPSVASSAEVETQSVPLPRPTAIETEIEVQPDGEPPLTEVVVGRYTTSSTTEEEQTSSEFPFSVEVITGSSPEVLDQRTEAVPSTTAKSVVTSVDDSKTTTSIDDSKTTTSIDDSKTTTSIDDSKTTTSIDDSKITTSIDDKATKVQTETASPDITKLFTPSEVPEKTSTHTEDDATRKTTDSPTVTELTQSTLSELEKTPFVSTIKESTTAELPKVSEVPGETVTESLETASTGTITEQEILTLPPKQVTVITSTEEQGTSIEFTPESPEEKGETSATKHQSTEAPVTVSEVEEVTTEISRSTEEAETLSISEKADFITSIRPEVTEDLGHETTPAPELKPTESVEVTTLRQADKTTEKVATSSEVLSETTTDGELSERTASNITQEIDKETPSEETSETYGTEIQQPVETVTHTSEKTITVSKGLTETVSTVDVTSEVTTSPPELGEVITQLPEKATGTISTTAIAVDTTSSESKVPEEGGHAVEEIVTTVSEDVVTKTPADEILGATVPSSVDRTAAELTTQTSQDIEEGVSIDTTSHAVERSTPVMPIITHTQILDETTPTILAETTHKGGVTSIVTSVKPLEDLDEARLSTITESATPLPDETTQKVEPDIISTTEKPLEETVSPSETESSTGDLTSITPGKIHESTTYSVTEHPSPETTEQFTEKKIIDVTLETGKPLLTTTEEIVTKDSVSEFSETKETELSTSTKSVVSTEHITVPSTTMAKEETQTLTTESASSLAETEQTDVDIRTQTYLQPGVPSEEPQTTTVIQETTKYTVTDATTFSKEKEDITKITVPSTPQEVTSTAQTPLQTEVPSEEIHIQHTTTQEASTEDVKEKEIGEKFSTEKEAEKLETESTYSSTVGQESTTETQKQPEVPSETPYKEDTTISSESTKSSLEPITQSTLIHKETEESVKGQTETTIASTELEKSTAHPLITERIPIEQQTVNISQVETVGVTEKSPDFTTVFDDRITTSKILSDLSTPTALERGTSIVTETEKADVQVSTTQQTTHKPEPTKGQEETKEPFWTSWFSTSVPTTRLETTSEKTTEPPTTTTIKTTSPKTEPTDDSSEEPIFVQKGACVFNGIVYQSAEQIPRTDACEFCFCFRGDIICLHQGCPPPMTLCYEREVPGFCCPHYVCHSPKPLYNVSDHTSRLGRIVKRSAEVKGCEVNGEVYRVGDLMQKFSSPCLQCKCDPSGSMTCEPQKCKPQEPLLLKLNKEFFRKKQ